MAPVILQGKRILQELCRDGVGWDDNVPEDIRPRWERWHAELPALEKLKVPRCHKLNEFGEIKKVALHHFSDVSQNGYGQCSYLRLTDYNDCIHCPLVMVVTCDPSETHHHAKTRANHSSCRLQDRLHLT